MTKKQASKQVSTHSTIKDLAILFSIPIGIFLVALGALYVPRLLANPQYDFIYATCSSYACKHDASFTINSDGRLQDTKEKYESGGYIDRQKPLLRYYEVKRDASRPISKEEARRYVLDSSTRSPDGYTLKITGGASASLFLWSSSSSGGWQLENGMKQRSVNLSEGGQSFYGERDIKFIGWVKDEE